MILMKRDFMVASCGILRGKGLYFYDINFGIIFANNE